MNVHKGVRLTPMARQEIWRLYNTGEWIVVALAERYLVSRPTIYKALQRGRKREFAAPYASVTIIFCVQKMIQVTITSNMQIIFMGTPEFAVPALKALIASKYEIVAVYTQPPRPAGRGQKERKSPVQLLAEENNIPVFTPEKLATPLLHHSATLAVVAAYGLLLPEWFLQSFKYGCINIHPSALPRWRGAAPIQRTVLAGDTHTDICIMQMEKGLDTGAVLKRETLPVPLRITSGELHDMLSEKSVPLLLDVLKNIENVKPELQSAEGVTYAKKIEKSEARIDWKKSAEEIDRLVRGLNPFPGAYFEVNGERVKILRSQMTEDRGHKAGEILDDKLTIACGDGALRPKILQRAGKKPMNTHDFLTGFPIPKGIILSSVL